MRAPVLAALLAVASSPPAAWAQEIPRLHLVWEAPAGCPDRESFLRQLAVHLGDVAPASQMHVEVVVSPTGRELTLTLRTRSGAASGERSLRGRDCTVLAETAALTLALAIAPESVKAGAGSREPGRDDEIPPGGRRVDGAPTAAVTNESGREWGIPLAIRAGVAGELGGLPGLSPGFTLAIATRLARRWRLEGLAWFWLQRRATAAADPSVAADLSSAAAGVRVCAELLGRRLLVGLCAGAELARTRAMASRPGSWLWFSLLGGPSLSWNLSRSLGLRLDAEVVGRPYYRPRFVTEKEDPILIHTPAWVGARASLGIEAYFP